MSSKAKKAQEPSFAHSIGVTDVNVVETTFKWVVNNFSFCQKGFGNKLNSPIFETPNNKSITWRMDLDPNTSKNFNNFCVNLKLVQSNLSEVYATFEIMIVNKDGSIEKSTSSKSAIFYKGTSKSSKIFMSNGYLKKNAQKILPNDTLTLLCKIKANLNLGVSSTMKAKVVPKQKIQAPCNQAGEVATRMKAKIGSKQKIQSHTQIDNLTEAVAKMEIKNLPKPNNKTQAHLDKVGTVKSKPLTNVAANIYPPASSVYVSQPPIVQLGVPSFKSTNLSNVASEICPPCPVKTVYASLPRTVPVVSSFGSAVSNAAINIYPTAYAPVNTTFASLPRTVPVVSSFGSAVSNAAINIYPTAYAPVNTTFASLPPSVQLGVSGFTSTTGQYKPGFVSSGNTAAQSANSSTPKTFSSSSHVRNNYCKTCKFHFQYCKCTIHCKYCGFDVKICECIFCEYCKEPIEDCECEYCPYCDLNMMECTCDTCEYCGSYEEECECPHCIDCDCHVEDCECEDSYCDYCHDHLDVCECDFCPYCDLHYDDCECVEFGKNHFYY